MTSFFFFHAPAPTEIYTLSLHDALPILTMASFATLDSRFWPEAMAVFHLLRNIGSSFFISVCVADIVRVTAQKDRKSTRLNSSHMSISYAVFCLKKKKK